MQPFLPWIAVAVMLMFMIGLLVKASQHDERITALETENRRLYADVTTDWSSDPVELIAEMKQVKPRPTMADAIEVVKRQRAERKKLRETNSEISTPTPGKVVKP